MTETDWANATSPHEMLRFLRANGPRSGRKLRLVECGCVRRLWDQISEDFRQLLEALESRPDSDDKDSPAAAWTEEQTDDLLQTLCELVKRGQKSAERRAQCELLRDIFGTPHRPLRPLAPALLGWNGGLLLRLAQGTYEHRQLPSGHLDKARLAILADALLDAGCEDDALIGHLREIGPHYRGCVGVDAVLGLE